MKEVKRFIFLIFNIALIFGCSNSVQNNGFQGMAYIKYVSDIAVPFVNERPVPIGYELQYIDLPELTAPTFHFKGWYDGFNKINVGTKVTKNMTLRAKWIDPTDKIPPKKVENVKVERKKTVTNNLDGTRIENYKTIVSWTAPTDKDFYGIAIKIFDSNEESAREVILDKNSSSYVLKEDEYKLAPGEAHLEIVIGGYFYVDLRTFDINNNFSESFRYIIVPNSISAIPIALNINLNITGEAGINLENNSKVTINLTDNTGCKEYNEVGTYSIYNPIKINAYNRLYDVTLSLNDGQKNYVITKEVDLREHDQSISFDI